MNWFKLILAQTRGVFVLVLENLVLIHNNYEFLASIQECYEPIQTRIPGILFSTFFNEPVFSMH
jgi:hypothetical protein